MMLGRWAERACKTRGLDSCDIGDPAAVRDYAILMLVARLGLRSTQAARLQLDDLDWRAGADRLARQGVP
jgi:integrase